MSEQILALLEDYPFLQKHIRSLMEKRESAWTNDQQRRKIELVLKDIRLLGLAARRSKAA